MRRAPGACERTRRRAGFFCFFLLTDGGVRSAPAAAIARFVVWRLAGRALLLLPPPPHDGTGGRPGPIIWHSSAGRYPQLPATVAGPCSLVAHRRRVSQHSRARQITRRQQGEAQWTTAPCRMQRQRSSSSARPGTRGIPHARMWRNDTNVIREGRAVARASCVHLACEPAG